MTAPLGLLTLFWVSVFQHDCIELSFVWDGEVTTQVSVEFLVSGAEVVSRRCLGGFSVSPDAVRNGADLVFVTADNRFEFGPVSAQEMETYLNARAWRVEADTPPFAPENWSLMLDVPRDVEEVLIIRTGNGFVTTRYDTARYGDPSEATSWRALLRRVDLIETESLVCLPKPQEWTLDSPVTTVSADKASEELCGSQQAMRSDEIREIATEFLEEFPAATVADLFETIKRETRKSAMRSP